MTSPLSIVIPSHSRADLLRLCLGSVTRHAPPGTEVLVVDDASPRAAVSRAAVEFDGVRVLRLAQRGGFCATANTGIDATSAPFVQLLHDDTQVTAGWAEAALSRVHDASVVAVAPLVWQSREGGRQWEGEGTDILRIDSAGDDYDIGGFARNRGRGRTLSSATLPGSEVFGASASSAFYRRE